MQLGGAPTFCDKFDAKNAGIPSRTGDLDPNVWGVSRANLGGVSFGQGLYNGWASTTLQGCNGSSTVSAPNDIVVCNGQLREAVNDNPAGCNQCGGVFVLAMYPKQPFDFAGRTGAVSFDVSNDSHGIHAAWPEFWLTSLPVPIPFYHGGAVPLPQHGLGVRFAASVVANQYGLCPNGNNLSLPRWTVDSAMVIRNYIYEDVNYQGVDAGTPSNPPLKLTIMDCVVASPDNSGIMNHVEIQINANEIDVYASDAGQTALRIIAKITNANLSLARGLVWLEDVHYNADKGFPPSQRQHTFVWDNLAFDGPFTYRDFSYDALDNTQFVPNYNVTNLGQPSQPNQSASWNVLNMPSNPQASAVRVLFSFYAHYPSPTQINISVNGNQHSVPWPYPVNPGDAGESWRTYALAIPITDLVAGTNVVQIGADQQIVSSNVNIVLVDVPGGVPVLPGSNNAYPAGSALPSQ
jgi:hypothetical protein